MYTSNKPGDAPEPTLDQTLTAAEGLLAEPRPIGAIGNQVVWLHPSDRMLSWGGQHPVRCSVDHPYLDGTSIRRAALHALGE